MELSEQKIGRNLRATSGCLFVLGWLVPTMFAQFPIIRAQLQIEEWQITLFILSMAVGAVPSMIIGSQLISRVGSRRLVLISMPLFLCLPPLFMLVPNYPLFLLLGFAIGTTTGFHDVAANSQGSLLERITDRYFMTTIHAAFALGVLIGAVLATLAHAIAMPMALFFLIQALLSSSLIFFLWRDFLPFALERKYDEKAEEAAKDGMPRLSLLLLIALSVLMLLSIEAEASNYDWLTQFFAQEFTLGGAPLSEFWFNASMIFFSSGLFIARAFGDWIADQIGRPKLLLWGTIIGLMGLVLLILTHSYWLGLFASFLMGFGFAFFFPIFVAAAGRLNGVRPAFGVALVSAMGWASIFIGPPLIGAVAHYADFRWAYATIIPVAVLVAIFGPFVVFKSRPENH